MLIRQMAALVRRALAEMHCPSASSLCIGYDTAANALREFRDHYRVYRSCETDAVRGPAARPFVQDAQSAMRLPESRSRRSRDLLSGSRMALCAFVFFVAALLSCHCR